MKLFVLHFSAKKYSLVIVGESDICDVIFALQPVESRWKLIGIKLGISMSTLDTITENHPQCFDRLVEVVKEWSYLNYDVKKFGRPNWRKLAEAVASFNKRFFYSLAYDHKIDVKEESEEINIQACTEGTSIQACNDEGTNNQVSNICVKQEGATAAPGAKIKPKKVYEECENSSIHSITFFCST